jgi:hypothetical protein
MRVPGKNLSANGAHDAAQRHRAVALAVAGAGRRLIPRCAPWALCFLAGGFGLPKGFLRKLVSLSGVFHRQPGLLVRGQVVFLAMMRGRNAVCMRREFVEFRGSLVRIIRHVVFS